MEVKIYFTTKMLFIRMNFFILISIFFMVFVVNILNNPVFLDYTFPSVSEVSMQNTLQSALRPRDKKIVFIALSIFLSIAAAAIVWYFNIGKQPEKNVLDEQQTSNVSNHSDGSKPISKEDQEREKDLSDPRDIEECDLSSVQKDDSKIQDTTVLPPVDETDIPKGEDSQSNGIEIVKDRPYSAQTNNKHGDRSALYSGEWKDDQPHGKGVMVYPNAMYEGDFKDGEQTGYGKLMKANQGLSKDDSNRYIDCEYYEGGFEKGVRQGFGRVYRPRQNGRMPPGIFIGQYKDGQSDGFGMSKSSTGNVYIGQYQRNKECGCGLAFNSQKIDTINLANFDLPDQALSKPADSFVHPITIGLVARINNALERKAAVKVEIAFDQALFSELSKKCTEAQDTQAFYASILTLDFAEACTNPEHMDNLQKIVHLFELCFLNNTFSPVITQYMDIYDSRIEKLA